MRLWLLNSFRLYAAWASYAWKKSWCFREFEFRIKRTYFRFSCGLRSNRVQYKRMIRSFVLGSRSVINTTFLILFRIISTPSILHVEEKERLHTLILLLVETSDSNDFLIDEDDKRYQFPVHRSTILVYQCNFRTHGHLTFYFAKSQTGGTWKTRPFTVAQDQFFFFFF